jgi:Family of unknown function (DUF6338)
VSGVSSGLDATKSELGAGAECRQRSGHVRRVDGRIINVLPSGVLTVGLLVALVPGRVYLRLRSTANAALPRAGLDELLEVVAVGFATTGIAVALWALIPADMSRLADIRSLSSDGAS